MVHEVALEVVGATEIPEHRYQVDMYREVVEQIPDGQALVLRFECYEDLATAQRRLHDAAERMFGERGHLRTKRNGYATGGLDLLVWVVEAGKGRRREPKIVDAVDFLRTATV